MSSENNKKELLDKIKVLQSVVQSIARETDHNKLLEITVRGAKELTNADGGTLYVRTDNNHLKFEILINSSLGIHIGGTSYEKAHFDPLPLLLEGQPNHSNVAAHCVLADKIINLEDAYLTDEFDFSGARNFDKKTGYRSKSFLTIPLKNHEKEIIGCVQLINSLDSETGEIVSFAAEDQIFAEFLATLAANALTNFELIQQQERLFDAFAQVIASAIDDKSPHTGQHCKRVPEITMMLAEAACEADWGPFKDFSMTDIEKRELQLAALLHDCGKITTPVHVIEKGTKLETIIDRIHLVDTRFGVIKRDAEISALKKKLELYEQNNASEATLAQIDENLKTEISNLNSDREFIREVNIGGEFLADEKVERIKAISRRKWTNEEGIQENFLNFNEVSCLSIRKGTLTAEEREIINRHIDVTIMMLEQLPYPKHLARIPEFAGGHHERMDGKGRPKGLTKDQMSLQARIMGTAEIYEALTARERPYKKGKSLSESLKILGYMKEDQHIDPDVFQLLIESGIFMEYARLHVDPKQIDKVDLGSVPGFDLQTALKRSTSRLKKLFENDELQSKEVESLNSASETENKEKTSIESAS